MTPTGGAVYAKLSDAIGYSDCPNAENISIDDTPANKRFDEIYAGLMKAHAAQTPIEIEDGYSATFCSSAGSTIKDPYLRFLK